MSMIRRIIKYVEPHPGEHFKDKAIAVALALMLWVAVSADEGVLQIYQAVPVEAVNLPPGLAIAGPWEDSVTVRARVPSLDVGNLTSGLLSPTINLSDAVLGDNFFPLSADDLGAPRGVQVVSIDPAQIRIVVEEKVRKEVIVAAVTSGEPARGFQVVGRRTDPRTVLLAGPRSLIEGLEQVVTSTVDVTGRRAAFSQAVTLIPGNPLIDLPQRRTVQLSIDIVEQAVNEQFDGVRVEVINNEFSVTVNPEELSVVLSAPPSVLEQIDVESMRMVIDATGLRPQGLEDYRLEPTLAFDQEGLGALVEVIAILPQRRINVHVYDRPSRQ